MISTLSLCGGAKPRNSICDRRLDIKGFNCRFLCGDEWRRLAFCLEAVNRIYLYKLWSRFNSIANVCPLDVPGAEEKEGDGHEEPLTRFGK